MKLSKSTVKRVWMHWIKHHEPIPIKKFGRKKKETDEGSEELILKMHEEQKLGARRLEKIIEFKYGKHIPHNRIHQVLLTNELAQENKNKKKPRKDWIRYERKHSLTAIHLDCYTSKINKKEVSVALDDSSRYTLAGDEFDAATGENSISIVVAVLNEYGWIRKIE
jgi:putative transposase